jgi:hypothetical protein
VHVPLLVAAGAGPLRPQLLAKLAPETRRGARRVEDALLLHLRVPIGGARGRLLGIEELPRRDFGR